MCGLPLADGAAYSVREVSPWKETFDTTRLDTLTRFTNLAEQWGQVQYDYDSFRTSF